MYYVQKEGKIHRDIVDIERKNSIQDIYVAF